MSATETASAGTTPTGTTSAEITPLERFHERMERIQKDGFDAVTPSPKTRTPADYPRQIERLKEQGCQIGDKRDCRRMLRNVTYYRLKGYLLPFKDGEGRVRGANFSKIRYIHEFDNQMRVILLQALFKIELHLRAQFSFFHTHTAQYGPYGYLKAENYAAGHDHKKFLSIVENSVREHKKIPFVKHYLDMHEGMMPFWVMSELLSFGQWAFFYRDLGATNRKAFLQQLYGINGEISDVRKELSALPDDNSLTKEQKAAKEALRKYDMAEGRFFSWLKCCSYLRNVCAHCGRLYDMQFPWNPAMPIEFLRVAHLNRRLFGGVLAIMFLYPDAKEWNREVLQKISDLLDFYSGRGIYLSRLGFPRDDWKDWLKKE